MKKNLVRMTALLLAAFLCICLPGCGKKKGGNSAKDVEISYWNAGLGTKWLDAVIKGFKKEHPEYNVYYTPSASQEAVLSTYGLEDMDTVDLYMVPKVYDTSKMEKLDDVLNAKSYGDSKTIGEKFYEGYLALERNSAGEIHCLTNGGGVLGFVYNKKLFEDAGIATLPRTTDELTAVCDKLSAKGITPIAYFKPQGYWSTISEAWFAQYNGLDYYLNTFYGNPTKETLLKKDGRFKALQAYEKFITPDYIMPGSNSNDHITVQTEFLNKKAAIMVNGSWLANEMAGSGKTDDFLTMRLPVLSAITDRLSTVKGDTALRNLISAIDDVAAGQKKLSDFASGDGYQVDGNTVSKKDWDIVSEARNMVPINYSGEGCFIPTYSNAKEGAKEFLKYMYSDKGYKIYTDTLHIPMPLSFSEGEVDVSKWNSFEKNQYEILSGGTTFVSEHNSSKHRLFTDGGADPYASVLVIPKFCSKNAADRLDAESAWEKIVKTIEDNYEDTWLKNIK